jgi:hypothetical protein
VLACEKLSSKDERITTFIDLQLWDYAIDSVFKYKREDEYYLDDIRKKGPPYVEDMIA